MGDPNASIPTPQPIYTRPMFASLGRSVEHSTVTFVSEAAQAMEIKSQLGLTKQRCRSAIHATSQRLTWYTTAIALISRLIRRPMKCALMVFY